MVADLQRLRRCLPGDVLRLELLDRPSAMTERTRFVVVASEVERREGLCEDDAFYTLLLTDGSIIEVDGDGTRHRWGAGTLRCRIIGGPYREVTDGRPSLGATRRGATRRETPDDEPFGSESR